MSNSASEVNAADTTAIQSQNQSQESSNEVRVAPRKSPTRRRKKDAPAPTDPEYDLNTVPEQTLPEDAKLRAEFRWHESDGMTMTLHSVARAFYGPESNMPPISRVMRFLEEALISNWQYHRLISRTDIEIATGVKLNSLTKVLKKLEADKWVIRTKTGIGKCYGTTMYRLHPDRYGLETLYRGESSMKPLYEKAPPIFRLIQGGLSPVPASPEVESNSQPITPSQTPVTQGGVVPQTTGGVVPQTTPVSSTGLHPATENPEQDAQTNAGRTAQQGVNAHTENVCKVIDKTPQTINKGSEREVREALLRECPEITNEAMLNAAFAHVATLRNLRKPPSVYIYSSWKNGLWKEFANLLPKKTKTPAKGEPEPQTQPVVEAEPEMTDEERAECQRAREICARMGGIALKPMTSSRTMTPEEEAARRVELQRQIDRMNAQECRA